MTEDELDRHCNDLLDGRSSANLAGHPQFRTLAEIGLDAGFALLAECRRLRALVEQVKALAWGDHPEAGADPAAIREYLRDLLVVEPDGPIDQRPGAAHAAADCRR